MHCVVEWFNPAGACVGARREAGDGALYSEDALLAPWGWEKSLPLSRMHVVARSCRRPLRTHARTARYKGCQRKKQ